MPIVTFTSDFGTSDHYVAAVKATILTAIRDIQVVDISHHIEPYDISHMAYVLRSVYQQFPAGTIHLIGNNTNAEGNNSILIAEINEHLFVGPDNGIISLIHEQSPARVYRVENEAEDNFHTLEAAKVACQLSKGADPGGLGAATDQYVQLLLRQPKATRREIAGHVIRVDHYGNLITNIKKQDFDILSRNRRYTLVFGREKSDQVHQTMTQVDPGEAFFIFNREHLLEIGINQGNAAQLLGLSFDSPVNIQFQEDAH